MSSKAHNELMIEGLMGPTKIRKRGCSYSSSSSSRVCNYRLNKRAILVGKKRAELAMGLGRSRSSTPVPPWRTTPLRSAVESPMYSQSGKPTLPVSARRLAATLWEMNETATPKMSEVSSCDVLKVQQKKSIMNTFFKMGKMEAGWGLHSGSGSLPPHLSDLSHSPAASSEKIDRSYTDSHLRKSPSISRTLMILDQKLRPIDSISNVSLMEIEARSRPPTSTGSTRNNLKYVKNALVTSKELLKIIHRMWTRAGGPSPSPALLSALHAELEWARLHINHLIQGQQRPGPNETHHIIKLFTEEKATWNKREQQAVEAAIGPVMAELEAERKIRRRLETLNKKLGKELSEVKSSFLKTVKELENEKWAPEITEELYDELATNIDVEGAGAERVKMESFKAREEVEKERERLGLADELWEERVQMKLTKGKHQYEEEKNSAVTELSKRLEYFLHAKRDEVVDIKPNADKNSKRAHTKNKGITGVRGRNSCSKLGSRRGDCLQRSASDGEFLDKVLDMENPRKSYFDERQMYLEVRGVRDQVRLRSRQTEDSWPSRDPFGGSVDDADGMVHTNGSKSRTSFR